MLWYDYFGDMPEIRSDDKVGYTVVTQKREDEATDDIEDDDDRDGRSKGCVFGDGKTAALGEM